MMTTDEILARIDALRRARPAQDATLSADGVVDVLDLIEELTRSIRATDEWCASLQAEVEALTDELEGAA
jgi:hypothetical protein